MGKISVIIPVYNIEKKKAVFLMCLYSVLKQTFDNIEVILVNDGSTDKTSSILKKIRGKDKRIKVINKENGGVESARRKGLCYVEGEFVIHMDQDDLLRKDALEIMYNYIEESKADIAVADSVKFVWMPCINWGRHMYWVESKVISHEEFMNNYYKGFYGINIFPVNIWNKLYRRSFLEAYSEPPITGFYNEDLSYNLHVMPNAKKIVLIAEKLYYYRWGGFTTKRISSLLDTAINCYQIKMNKIRTMNLEGYEITTSIELLNYLNSYFYQLIEYDNISTSDFVQCAEEVLSLPEAENAIKVVKTYGKYRNDHVNCMLAYDYVGLYNVERLFFEKSKWKRFIKNILHKMF